MKFIKFSKCLLIAGLLCSFLSVPILAHSLEKGKTQNAIEKEMTPIKTTKPNQSSSRAIISSKTNLTELNANHAYSADAIVFTNGSPNLFIPTYEKNFGYQITHLEKLYVEVEIVNTGNSTLNVNNDTLGFVLYNQDGTNVSGSQILEGKGPLKPGEKRLVKVSASNPNTSIFTVALNGRENGQTLAQGIVTKFAGDAPMSDTTPLSVPYESNYYITGWEGLPKDEWILTPTYNGLITGNGKIKVQSLGIKILENQSINGLPQLKDSTGGYVLVQYRLANTSNEVMTIDEILLSSIYPDIKDRSNDTSISLQANSEIFKELELAVPSVVKPNSIVDFYLPATYPTSDYLAAITVKTNLGVFENSSVGTFMPSK